MSFGKLLKNLAFWVILAIIAGVILGGLAPEFSTGLKPGIDYFIKILKWMVGPIIFFTIISGIVGLESVRDLGTIGLKGTIYFEVVSTLALAVGIVVALILQPGSGMHLSIDLLAANGMGEMYASHEPQKIGILSVLKGAIPSDPITPFLKGNTLQVLFMALCISIILIFAPAKIRAKIIKPVDFCKDWVLKILLYFMWASPVAAFCAMAFLIGKFGFASIWGMGALLFCMLVACLFFIFVVLGLICLWCKINIFKFMRFIAPEVLVVFATSSSEAALGPLMKKLEIAGIDKGCVGLLVPTGYSFNLDCTNIYLSMCVIFLAQAFNIDLSFSQLLSTLLILMVTSKGAVGVTGSGFVVLAGTLGALGVIPVAAVAVLLGVDKFMSEMRAVGNLCGNSVACLIVGIWDKKINLEKFRYALNHPNEFHVKA